MRQGRNVVTPPLNPSRTHQGRQGEARTPAQGPEGLQVGLWPPVLLPQPRWPPRSSSDLPKSVLCRNSPFLPLKQSSPALCQICSLSFGLSSSGPCTPTHLALLISVVLKLEHALESPGPHPHFLIQEVCGRFQAAFLTASRHCWRCPCAQRCLTALTSV